ncbi:hypothetical protein [Saccharolobus sp.]|uniref:hypothetical protein n=1 Tax=Saccharolobus sp. TaxID=2100761 RepID=UPI0031790079
MSSDSLSGNISNDLSELYEAFDILTKLKDDLAKKSVKLTVQFETLAQQTKRRKKQRMYEEISNKIRQTYVLASDAHGIADYILKILNLFFTTPDHTTTFSVEMRGVKIDKDSVRAAIYELTLEIEQLTNELSRIVDEYKNVIESQYVGAIEQYISMLEDFRSAFVRFGEIATNILPS